MNLVLFSNSTRGCAIMGKRGTDQYSKVFEWSKVSNRIEEKCYRAKV